MKSLIRIALLLLLFLFPFQVAAYTNEDCPTDDVQISAPSGILPVIGDFNSDGLPEIGSYSGTTWILDSNADGVLDQTEDETYTFDQTGLPVIGDFNGNGTLDIGIFRDGSWYLDLNNTGVWESSMDTVFSFGQSDDYPIVGDWNGDGKDQIGVYRDGVFYLDWDGDGTWSTGSDLQTTGFDIETENSIPVVGDWNGIGVDRIGIYSEGQWRLDLNGNYSWDGSDTDLYYPLFGDLSSYPMPGDWSGNGLDTPGVLTTDSFQLDTTADGTFTSGSCESDYNAPGEDDFDPSTLESPEDGTGLCGADLDEDGIVSQSEMDNCDSGVCPLDRVECTGAGEGVPVCPEGGELDPDNDVCQVEANPTCPEGYTLNSDLNLCLAAVICPDSSVFNASSDRCEQPVINECPSSYSYDEVLDVCSTVPDCNDITASFQPSTDRCEKLADWICPGEYVFNEVTSRCETSPQCANSTVYNPITDRCEDEVQNDCPTGYSYDPVNKSCVTTADCLSPGILNTSTDRCETSLAIECPAGYTYSPVEDLCIASVSCPTGGAYSATSDQCEAPVSGEECPEYYSYDTDLAKCIHSPLCANGAIYQPDRDRCEIAILPECPSDTIFNEVTSLCESFPECPDGSVYQPVRNRCEIALNACALGFSWDSALNTCVNSSSCPDGTFLNTTTDRCEQTASNSCPSSYTYDSGTDSCLMIPECPSGGSYDSVSDLCLASPTTTSCEDGYTYDTDTGSCLASPVCPEGVFEGASDSCLADTNDICSLTGYTYNSETGRCEMSPLCSSGSYNSASNMCEEEDQTSYPATGSFESCSMTCVGCYRGDDSCTVSPGGVCSFRYDFYTLDIYYFDSTCGIWKNRWEDITDDSYHGSEIYEPPVPPGDFLEFDSVVYTNTSAETYTCPSGGTLDETDCVFASIVQTTPDCAGGTLDDLLDVCYESTSPSCPTGYTLSGSVCILSPPSCPGTGGVYDSALNLCVENATYACDTGYVYDPAEGTCTASPPCEGGILNGSIDFCQTAFSYECPSGYDLDGDTCYVSPFCDTGSAYSSAFDLCDAGADVCSAGFSLDAAWDICQTGATCPNSTILNQDSDLCETSYTTTCGTGYSLDSGLDVCYLTSSCYPGGILSEPLDQCIANASYICDSGYTYDSAAGICIATPDCLTGGTLDTDNDQCRASADTTCPDGFDPDLATGLCYRLPSCLSPGIYSGGLDSCQSGVTKTCPTTGTTYDSGADICWSSAQCPDGSLSATEDICLTPGTVDCGSLSWDNTAGVCYDDPVCDSGTYSDLNNQCQTLVYRNCGALTYNSLSGICEDPGSCPTDIAFSGTQAFTISYALDQCTNPIDPNCPTSYTYEASPTSRCEAEVDCSSGTYDSATDLCTGGSVNVCPAGDYPCLAISTSEEVFVGCPDNSSYDSATGTCLQKDIVISGSAILAGIYDFHIDGSFPQRLYSESSHIEFSFDGEQIVTDGSLMKDSKWEAVANGNHIDWYNSGSLIGETFFIYSDGNLALSGPQILIPEVLDIRPSSNFFDVYNNETFIGRVEFNVSVTTVSPETELQTYCSPYECIDYEETEEETEPDTSSYQNDGEIDSDTGSCLGQIYIFNGHGKYCLEAGVKTSFFNCCNPNPSSWLFFQKVCPEDSLEVAYSKKGDSNHYIGSFCMVEWPLVGCVQEAQMHCIFSTKLARVVHECARVQLEAFQPDGAWGDEDAPNCRGFKPEEFNVIDMGQCDLSEVYGDLVPSIPINQIQEQASEAVQNY